MIDVTDIPQLHAPEGMELFYNTYTQNTIVRYRGDGFVISKKYSRKELSKYVKHFDCYYYDVIDFIFTDFQSAFPGVPIVKFN